jgi:hypothetical protein
MNDGERESEAGKDETGEDGEARAPAIELGLNAVIVTMHEDEPHIVAIAMSGGGDGSDGDDAKGARHDVLPFGLFTPLAHRTLEIGLRKWVTEQTGLDLGYVEQLYTFGDRGRHARKGDRGPHMVSIGYLALTQEAEKRMKKAVLRCWYDFFPWEDWREGRPAIIDEIILPHLERWARQPRDGASPKRPIGRKERIHICFGEEEKLDNEPHGRWDEEKVLERYELLYEAGLVEEARRDGRSAAMFWEQLPQLGRPMAYDHRRIMATAMSRLRGKLKYRPLVFELLPPQFTLFELQKLVEAISGARLHKQNFRRLVEGGGLVEPTGGMKKSTGGRPARLFRCRHEALLERPAPGLRVRAGKG